MTATHTETNLEILEALDFEPEHECEHTNHGKRPWHGGPAKFLVSARSTTCPECGDVNSDETFALCAPAWEAAGTQGLMCSNPACCESFDRDDVWSIVGRL